jgi:hypothetical protein
MLSMHQSEQISVVGHVFDSAREISVLLGATNALQ